LPIYSIKTMRDVDFKDHIMFSFNLTEQDFERLMDEFLGYFGSTLEEFVRGRQAEFHKEGKKNQEIYTLIAQEAFRMRFAEDPLSERQIRRIIYG
jgi:hypothetical protein